MLIKRLKRSARRFFLNLPTRSKYKFILRDWIELSDLQACSKVLETKRFSRNIQPVELAKPFSQDIIVLAPHPDDDILGGGGTLLKAKDAGGSVTVVYFTNGSNDRSRAEKIKKESKSVCDLAGFSYTFLDFPAGQIPLSSPKLEHALDEIFSRAGTEIALFLPFFLADHDDHRRISQVIRESKMLTARATKIEIWAYQVYSTVLPNVIVDITKKVDHKCELLNVWKHVSGNRDWGHYIRGLNAANCRFMKQCGEVFGETFFVLPFRDYTTLANIYFEKAADKAYYGSHYRTL